MAQLTKIEAEPAFEQDERDPDSDHRIEQVAECMFGIEQTEHRTRQEARRKHQDDGWPTRPPGQPLGTYAQHADHRDD